MRDEMHFSKESPWGLCKKYEMAFDLHFKLYTLILKLKNKVTRWKHFD